MKQILCGLRRWQQFCSRVAFSKILFVIASFSMAASAQGFNIVAEVEGVTNALVAPSPGAVTNALAQVATLPAETPALSPTRKIHPALLEALREDQRQPPQTDALRARSHLIPRRGGRLLVNIKAIVTDSVTTNIQQSGGLIVNTFPQSQTIYAEIPIASLQTIANLTGVTDIQPAFFADSADHSTNAVDSAFGPIVHGVKPRSAE